MASPHNDDENPYRAPSAEALPVGQLAEGVPDPAIIKKFRQQIHALGAFWIIIGCIGLGLAAFALISGALPLGLQSGEITLALLFGLLVGGISVMWIVLGVLTCLKKMGAVYAGLVLSYLSLFGNLVRLNLCPLIVLIIAILQAHRVIKWGKQMQAMGVPLNAKPEAIRQ